MYVYIYVYIYIHIHVYVYIHVYIYIHVCIYVSLRVCVHTVHICCKPDILMDSRAYVQTHMVRIIMTVSLALCAHFFGACVCV